MLQTFSPTEQHGVALGFVVKEQRDAAAATTTTASSGTTPRVQSLKLHVSNYVGKEGEPLFRWLVEVDTAIAARRIFDERSKVAFAMSCLGERERSWAYGHRFTYATCFSTYATCFSTDGHDDTDCFFAPRCNDSSASNWDSPARLEPEPPANQDDNR
ncbi:hypothetical protein PC117_g6096 [Phytophthora cactorum]|uniref:Uncharacterized protein n=1 Tax=Phytophthora cactorum TaxID=29920 RepID=A0A8T1E9X1_9STRA|nr:hypothetical protein PC117_g6096 [Phytophthora cactorum]